MPTITIHKVLMAYEEPLVVLAHDGKNKPHIGVNYDDGENGYKFYFVRVSEIDLYRLLGQKIDLHFLIARLAKGKYLLGETWARPYDQQETTKISALTSEQLPSQGLFIPAGSYVEEGADMQVRTVLIDGRWGIDDWRRFSDLVEDCYAFVYALSGAGKASARQRIVGLFTRYPWRGGFSSLNFFNSLYSLIPQSDRADVKSISYASPGDIEFHVNGVVADTISSLVDLLVVGESEAEEAYHRVHDWLRVKKWLGKAQEDFVLTPQDHVDLKKAFTELAAALGLQQREKSILELASADPLASVKILLAYFRRVKSLADYVATGKAQQLFGTERRAIARG